MWQGIVNFFFNPWSMAFVAGTTAALFVYLLGQMLNGQTMLEAIRRLPGLPLLLTKRAGELVLRSRRWALGLAAALGRPLLRMEKFRRKGRGQLQTQAADPRAGRTPMSADLLARLGQAGQVQLGGPVAPPSADPAAHTLTQTGSSTVVSPNKSLQSANALLEALWRAHSGPTPGGGGEAQQMDTVAALLAGMLHPESEMRKRSRQALDRVTWEPTNETSVRSLAGDQWSGVGELDTKVLRELKASLQDPSMRVRTGAVCALAKIGDERAVPGLLAALDDRYEPVRVTAIGALVRLGRAAVAPLANLLRSGRPDQQVAATEALGAIDDSRALDALLAEMSNPNAWMRCAAAEALGNQRAPRAVDALAAALDDSDSVVCHRAADALGEIEAPSAVAALRGALEHEDLGTRLRAAVALASRSDPQGMDVLLETYRNDPAMRGPVAQALAGVAPARAVGPLVQLAAVDAVALDGLARVLATDATEVPAADLDAILQLSQQAPAVAAKAASLLDSVCKLAEGELARRELVAATAAADAPNG